MAASATPLSLNHHRSLTPKHHGVSLNSKIRVPTRFSSSGFTSRIRASSALAVEPFNMAQEYFEVAEGGVLVDGSCGSGLFSKKFAESGVYSRIIALGFSENMLCQCYDFIKTDESILSSNLALVRADVSRLPFFSGSVDAVHAGAALHCWPSPSNAIAEIDRILRSGGVFVGTTFLRVKSFSSSDIERFAAECYTDLQFFYSRGDGRLGHNLWSCQL